MSTCSTATSALRGHESRGRRRRTPPPARGAGVVEAVHGRLERRLVDLERDWDAYMTGRSGAPRHRRSRSATGTHSSAVTVAAPEADGLLLPLYRCSSPRRLVSSLQQSGSADSDRAAKIVISGAGGHSPTGPSSVCSVEAGYSVAAYSSSSRSRPCRCRCGVCYSNYSTSSSRTAAAVPLFSSASAAGGAAGGRARKSDGGRLWAGGRAAWISAIALVVVVFVALLVLELSVDEGCAEYLVPT